MNINTDRIKSFVPFLLMALAYLAYSNTFANGWTYDDFPVIVDNPDVRSFTAFLKDSYKGRPLRELTYLLDFKLFGLEPRGWHFQSIFWHGINAVLVWKIISRLSGCLPVAWGTSLLFLLHPIQVEVVANISHRKDALALFCVLLSFSLYLKSLERQRNKYLLLAAFSAWACGMYAKQVSIMLPLVIICYEMIFIDRDESFYYRYRKILYGVLVGSLLVGVSWFFFFGGEARFIQSITTNLSKNNVFGEVGIVGYFLVVFAYLGHMSTRLLWPNNLALEYTFSVSTSGLDYWTFLGLAFFLLSIVSACLLRRTKPVVSFGILWFLFFWLPVSNFWPVAYLAADRYWYLPLMGILLSVLSLLHDFCRGKKSLFLAAVSAVALCFVCLTWQQNKVWQSPKTLWAQAIAVSPDSSFALNNMGNVLWLEQDLDKAITFYLRAAEVNPFNPTTHFNLALIYEQRKQFKKALESYKSFLGYAGRQYDKEKVEVLTHLRLKYGWSPSSLSE